MFNTIFLKTLYEKRWMMCWWFISGLALVLFIATFFHTLQGSFGTTLKDVPESLKPLLGDAAAYQTLAGYLDLQVFAQMIFLPVTLGVIVCTGLLAGEEQDGTLQTLLAYPVSRTKVYLHKLAASVTIIAVVCLSLFGGCALGAVLIGESINLGALFLATLMAWLVSCLCGLIGFALAAATGKRGLSGSVAGAAAFAGYVLSTLAQGIPSLKNLAFISPFTYYNQPNPLLGRTDWGDVQILVIICLLLGVAGWLVFRRRDIYQR